MGKLSRDKGARWERELSNMLKAVWPFARRGLSQPRSGMEVADVEGTPFWWECKVGKAPPLLPALRQAEQAEEAYRQYVGGGARMPPIAVAKIDRERPVAVLYLGDLIDILRPERPGSKKL